MDYSKLSDFEINKLVASAQSLLINANQCASLKVKSSSVLVNDIVSSFEFNPCNNPSDAWPIILDSKIDIRFEGGFMNKWEAQHVKHLDDYDVDIIGDNYDKNPLRAAMVTYLMMQDDK